MMVILAFLSSLSFTTQAAERMSLEALPQRFQSLAHSVQNTPLEEALEQIEKIVLEREKLVSRQIELTLELESLHLYDYGYRDGHTQKQLAAKKTELGNLERRLRRSGELALAYAFAADSKTMTPESLVELRSNLGSDAIAGAIVAPFATVVLVGAYLNHQADAALFGAALWAVAGAVLLKDRAAIKTMNATRRLLDHRQKLLKELFPRVHNCEPLLERTRVSAELASDEHELISEQPASQKSKSSP